MGRRPLRGERAKPSEQETLRFSEALVERPTGRKDERVDSRREALSPVLMEGAPKRSRKAQESKGPDPS